jgi:hypothetical protein
VFQFERYFLGSFLLLQYIWKVFKKKLFCFIKLHIIIPSTPLSGLNLSTIYILKRRKNRRTIVYVFVLIGFTANKHNFVIWRRTGKMILAYIGVTTTVVKTIPPARAKKCTDSCHGGSNTDASTILQQPLSLKGMQFTS